MVSPHKSIEKPRDTREVLLDVAEELLSEHGYQKMTIDDIARRAGLGKGTTYLYFESKQDVALSVIDRINERLRARLRTFLRRHGSAAERTREMIIERVMYRFDSAQRFRSSIDELLACLRPSLLLRRQVYHDQEAMIFAEALIEGRALGEFEMDDPFEYAEAILWATSALLPYSLSPKELGDRESLRHRAELLAGLLVTAFKHGSGKLDGGPR